MHAWQNRIYSSISSFRATWNAHANEHTSAKWHIMVASGFSQQLEMRTSVFARVCQKTGNSSFATNTTPCRCTTLHVLETHKCLPSSTCAPRFHPCIFKAAPAFCVHLCMQRRRHRRQFFSRSFYLQLLPMEFYQSARCLYHLQVATVQARKKRWKIKNIWFFRRIQLHRVPRWKKIETNQEKKLWQQHEVSTL